MTHVISVRPEGGSWAVEAEPARERLTFLSAGAAERAAKTLADELARDGEAAEVRFHLRDGRLGARLLAPSHELQWL